MAASRGDFLAWLDRGIAALEYVIIGGLTAAAMVLDFCFAPQAVLELGIPAALGAARLFAVVPRSKKTEAEASVWIDAKQSAERMRLLP